MAALNKKLDEKNNTAEKIKLMEDFNDAHKLFDAKCRKVGVLYLSKMYFKVRLGKNKHYSKNCTDI